MVAKGENAHDGFKRLLSQGHLKLGLCGKELTLHHTIKFYTQPNSLPLQTTN